MSCNISKFAAAAAAAAFAYLQPHLLLVITTARDYCLHVCCQVEQLTPGPGT
jgi:hypothetical protein